MKILVTGGLGYIGSHTAIELINKGYNVIIVDNLVNSNIKVLDNIEKITGKRPEFHKIDLRNKDELNSIFQNTIFSGIIHFAALKSVSDSVNNAKLYYDNNVGSTENLLEIISSRKEKIDLIFSSSCTVYGQAKKLPIACNKFYYSKTRCILRCRCYRERRTFKIRGKSRWRTSWSKPGGYFKSSTEWYRKFRRRG